MFPQSRFWGRVFFRQGIQDRDKCWPMIDGKEGYAEQDGTPGPRSDCHFAFANMEKMVRKQPGTQEGKPGMKPGKEPGAKRGYQWRFQPQQGECHQQCRRSRHILHPVSEPNTPALQLHEAHFDLQTLQRPYFARRRTERHLVPCRLFQLSYSPS